MSTNDSRGNKCPDPSEQSADSDGATHQSAQLWERPVTVREQKVRTEGVDERHRPRSVSEGVDAFDQYISEKNEMQLEFENGTKTTSHRFSDDYAREKYGEVIGADRAITADMESPHCAIVTRRGYPWNANGNGRAIVDFLDDLLESNDNVLSAYRRNLDEFARVTTIEHHEHGYPHVHDHIYHDGEIDRLDLASAVTSHVRNSLVAREKGHPLDGAIRTWEADPHPPDGNPKNVPRTTLVGHITKSLCWEGGLNQEPSKKRLLQALWLTGTASFRPDSTWRDYVNMSQDPELADDRGSFEGVRLSDGSTIDSSELSGGGGGTDMVTARPEAATDPLPAELE